MEPPTYNGKESVNQYMIRVEKYKQYIQKGKIDLILQFINEWTKNNFNALTNFRNIQENVLLQNLKYNRELVRKYCDLFKNKFNIDLTIDLETDSEEIDDMYILMMLNKMLNIIDYVLVKRELGTKILYTILKK